MKAARISAAGMARSWLLRGIASDETIQASFGPWNSKLRFRRVGNVRLYQVDEAERAKPPGER
jgi:hypothetical protein